MSAKARHVHLLVGEVNVLHAAMKRAQKWNSTQDDRNQLLEKVVTLKQILSSCEDLDQIDAKTFLLPFLDIIRAEDTSVVVTTLALTTVHKILTYRILDHRSKAEIASVVEQICKSVTRAQFTGSNPASDEGVLMKVLDVLKTLVISPPGNFLTNESVCEIVGSFSTMSLTPKLSMLLRTISDTFLTEIIQHLFARLDREKLGEEMKDSTKRTMKKKLRNHILKRRAPVPPVQPAAVPEVAADSAPDGETSEPSVSTQPKDSVSVQSESVAESGGAQTGSQSDSVLSTSESVLTEATITSAGESASVVNSDSEPPTPAPVSWSMGEAAAPDEGDVDDDLEEEGSPEREVSEAETVETKEDSVDERGIRFSSPLPKNDSTGAYIPYGLPAISEILWYIVTLIRSEEKIERNSEMEFELKLNLGLKLLGTVLETSAHAFPEHPTLMPLIKDELCRNLTFLLQNDRLSIFTLTLRLSFFVFESMRRSLKLQMEHFFLSLMEVISSDTPKYTPEHKEAAIDLIIRLWRLPGFIAEIYLNYDCDLYCSDLYEDLVKLLSKNAFPVGNLTNVNVLALECLLIAVEKIDRNCQRALLDTLPRELPPAEHAMLQKHKVKKKLLINGTELFNKKPPKGIECLQEHGLLSHPLQPAEVAKFLRENSRLDKAMIGEFISKRENTQVLSAFMKTFDFAGKRLDEALRDYLESFRLPGESPLITHIMEHFAARWQLTCGSPYLSNDSAFVMSYAIIMLNTALHNETAKKQAALTLNDFKKQLSKVNKKDGAQTGEDFDAGLLEQIYHSISHEEIVMPAERTGRVKDLYLWKMLLRRADKASYSNVACGSFDSELFALLWGPTVSALSHAFDKTGDESVIRKTIGGFKKCAFIAASPRIMSCEIFDNIVVTLCKYSTLQNSTDPISVLPISFGQNTKAQLVTKTMFNLVHQHGDILRDGWKNIVECIVQLFRVRLLPEYFYTGDDFGLQKTVSLIREDPVIPKQESGILNSFFNFIAFDSGSRSTVSLQEETELKNIAKGCVEECKISDLVIDSKFLQNESLKHFVDALIVTGKNGQKPVQESNPSGSTQEKGPVTINEDQAIVCLETLVKVLIENRDRLGEQGLKLWPVVHDYFFTTLLQENRSEMTFLSERAVVGLLRLAVRFLRDHDKELQQEVLRSLKLLQGIRVEFFNRISRQVTFALYDLFQANATAIKSSEDWGFLLTLLECAGAGLRSSTAKDKDLSKPDSPPLVRVQPEVDSDRGYTSDPELYDNQSSLSPAGSMTWLMVGKEGEIVETGSAGERNMLVFPFEFVHHDKSAFFTAVESLRFLIKDTGRIVPENMAALVHCLCVFAEASVNGSAGINGRVQRTVLKKMDKRLQQKIQAERRTAGKNQSRPVSTPVSPGDEDSSDYIKESLVLLDVMHTVHVRAFSVCRSMRIDLWTEVWCPLLRAMARLCCDYRKIVRTDGLTWLNRSLLIPDLQALTPQQWEECILKVLFPLLLALRSDGKQPTNMEETIVRAAPLVCKVFLQHLSSLLSLPTFGELWMSILDLLEQFLKSDSKSDLVKEAVLESIKNMLLVMSTAGVFQEYTAGIIHENVLWDNTKAKVDSIVPGLIQHLLEITKAPPAERPVPVRSPSPDPSATVPFQLLTTEPVSASPPSSSLLLDPGILQSFPIPTLPLRNEMKPSGLTKDDSAIPPRTA
ncbi:LOW QUALITY PROTEIN: Golgi-specific brefeldin A-resistance guanine nucleotide exchange factor 1-like [Paramacrobiotus metropolitanus]|uniref:LOW QUALITY PROTEIN: Golgi-specific brefeldin A-resistance guanine nucleotide exchange factor 1-like n=1 Tax=Paramacrobiotus metropolitanus TaxID=2943436 RepID=UPI0024457F28|nr:LOW QUALITY PROTEIN: Golgi-specific brefeldin A-resistance guanine nucleotide exchange factor 1-like [Paramacrobiotus metropolitanus]